MGLIHGIRRLVEWGWFWSGCPLVVLIAAPALVMHTRHLAGPAYDPINECGARATWNRVTNRSGSWRTCHRRMSMSVHIVKDGDRYEILTWEELDERGLDQIDQDNTYHFHYSAAIRSEHGLWAKTVREVDVGLPILHGPTRVAEWPGREFKVVSVALAEAYKAHADSLHGGFDPDVYQWIKRGDDRFTEPIYAGYAHNALALFLLGMTGRGVFGSRRWWRACKARFRSKKNCCVACGYDLAGLGSGVCPECGDQRTDCMSGSDRPAVRT